MYHLVHKQRSLHTVPRRGGKEVPQYSSGSRHYGTLWTLWATSWELVRREWCSSNDCNMRWADCFYSKSLKLKQKNYNLSPSYFESCLMSLLVSNVCFLMALEIESGWDLSLMELWNTISSSSQIFMWFFRHVMCKKKFAGVQMRKSLEITSFKQILFFFLILIFFFFFFVAMSISREMKHSGCCEREIWRLPVKLRTLWRLWEARPGCKVNVRT